MKKVIVELKKLKRVYTDKVIINDIDLEVSEGEFLTILGPSGCGKTTILRAIAGFDEVTSGRIYLDGKDVTNLEPTKREVNTIFQNYALFSHLSIYENIAFGLRMKKVPKDEIKTRVDEMIKLVKLEGFENRKPKQLSGGQMQRVAIARALVNRPKVLLLDEPLSALDLKLRKEMQIELKLLQKKLGITFIYVTHSQEEALTMSDRVVIINNSKIEQIGTPKSIYKHPATKFVADFIGDSNIFTGEVIEKTTDKVKLLLEDNETLTIKAVPSKVGDKLSVVVRPEMINLHEEKVRNSIMLKVSENIYDGSLEKTIGNALNKRQWKITLNENEKPFPIGTVVYMSFDMDDIVVFKEIDDEKEKN